MASPSFHFDNSTSSVVPVTVVQPHGVAPQDRGVTISLTILAGAAVVLRLWARRHTRCGLGSDDWLILSALVNVLGITRMNSITHTFLGTRNRQLSS